MFPRWLTWAFVAVIVYMAFTVGQVHQPDALPVSRPVAAPETTEEPYKALAETTDVERWKRALNPEYAAQMQCSLAPTMDTKKLGFKIIEDHAGEGEAAACGETIRIALTVWGPTGGKAYETTLDLALGAREVAAGLDAGLIGLKPTGVRTLIMPPGALLRGKPGKEFNAVRKALPTDKLVVVTVTRQQ